MKELHPAARLMRALTLEAATWPDRIDRALTQLAHAQHPLHANHGAGTTGGTTSDPTPNAAGDQERHTAEQTRARLLNALRAHNNAHLTIANILTDWAPNPPDKKTAAAENASYWCANHRKHGTNTPRSADGSLDCDWCCNIYRNYKTKPNHALIKLHDQGRRLNDTDIRRTLGLSVVLKPGDSWT